MYTHRTPKSLLNRFGWLAPAALCTAGWAATVNPVTPAGTSNVEAVRPLFARYCAPCHGGNKPSAGVNLSTFKDLSTLKDDPATWHRVLRQLRAKSMPPAGAPQPAPQERDLLTTWVAAALDEKDAAPNPGRVLIHRLSRTEYNNSIRDLLGVDTHPADKFPPDGGGGGGFDNNADTLFVPPILMERYLQAAGEVLDAAKPERIFFAHPGDGVTPEDAARRILRYFVTHAYRRPAKSEDIDRLMPLFSKSLLRGESFEDSVKLALKAVLVSPQFLFRIEQDRGNSGAQPLGDYEMASRLSYFLWASMPDDELLGLAAQKRLHDPDVLDRQVTRMLQDPRSHGFADSFAGQWLRVRELYTSARPDPGRYPDFNDSLRDAMYDEAVDFFQDILKNNTSLLDLIDANYTYLNEPLARHYGIEGVKGPEMRRVALSDHRRGGILTMASVLTVTSYAQRTSPVLRGKWVLEQVLGTPVPPPPPGAGGLSADDAPKAGMTFRQRLEQHRSKPQCASCHSRMDPLGFGLENFDGDGRWRTEIGGTPVDSSGVLATGEKFSGPVELKQHLLTEKDQILRNLVEKMLAYALGRGLEDYDDPAVEKITNAVAQDGYRSNTLIKEIVKSLPFQYRQDGTDEGGRRKDEM